MTPTLVHVLTEETNGRDREGNAELTIVGIYFSGADADAERRGREVAARKTGKLIEGDEHAGDADPDDWDLSYGINLYRVQGNADVQARRDSELIASIFEAMNGREWSADTLDAIGQAFDAAGRPLADFKG
jgi:hypothetical protein